MPATRRYKQLKMSMEPLKDHYNGVFLSFRLHGHLVSGILNGSVSDWIFRSASPAFLKHFPSGRLHKYAVWNGEIPRSLSKTYNGIWEAALKAGYDLAEREEEAW